MVFRSENQDLKRPWLAIHHDGTHNCTIIAPKAAPLRDRQVTFECNALAGAERNLTPVGVWI
jgi:hypothetical protein